MPPSDWNTMDCSVWRDALSAMADGQQREIDERLVAAHVARCADCQSYKEMIDASPGRARRGHTLGAAPRRLWCGVRGGPGGRRHSPCAGPVDTPGRVGPCRRAGSRSDRRSGDGPHSADRRSTAPASDHQRLPHLVPRSAVNTTRWCQIETHRASSPRSDRRRAPGRLTRIRLTTITLATREVAPCAVGSSSSRAHRDR